MSRKRHHPAWHPAIQQALTFSLPRDSLREMSHFACPNYRSVLTRRDAIKVGGLGLLGSCQRNLRARRIVQEVTKADGRLSFLSDGNPISEVFD